MYIERVPNRRSPPAVLLRESFREGGRVRKRTLANLSHLPDATIEQLRRALRGESLIGVDEAFSIVRSRPHGHVAAVLGTLRKLRLERLLASRRSPERDRAVALIVARVLAPDSKLATARALDAPSATSTLKSSISAASNGKVLVLVLALVLALVMARYVAHTLHIGHLDFIPRAC